MRACGGLSAGLRWVEGVSTRAPARGSRGCPGGKEPMEMGRQEVGEDQDAGLLNISPRRGEPISYSVRMCLVYSGYRASESSLQVATGHAWTAPQPVLCAAGIRRKRNPRESEKGAHNSHRPARAREEPISDTPPPPKKKLGASGVVLTTRWGWRHLVCATRWGWRHLVRATRRPHLVRVGAHARLAAEAV